MEKGHGPEQSYEGKGSASKSYYEILGIDRGASDAEIKSTFRRRAIETHPDTNKEDQTREGMNSGSPVKRIIY